MSALRLSWIRMRVVVWGLALAFVCALALAALAIRWNMLRTHELESEAQVQHFVAGATEAVNRVLLGVDVLLASTDEMLGLSSASSLWVDAPSASQLLHSAARQNLMVRHVALVDGAGKVLASSDPAGERVALELPAGFLSDLIAQPLAPLSVSAPVVSFSSYERVLYMARAFRTQGGTPFVVVAQMPVASLLPVLMQSVDIPELQVTIERDDGELLVRAPGTGARARPAAPLREGAHWQQSARLTQADALVVAQPTLYPALWVSASLPRAAVLAESQGVRQVVLWATVVFAALVLLGAFLAQTYLLRMDGARRQTAHAKTLLDEALASMVSGFMLLDAERRVVQWNSRFEEIFPWLRSTISAGMAFRQVLEATVRVHLPQASPAQQQAWVDERLGLQSHAEGAAHEQHLPTGRDIQVVERATPDGGLVITYHDVTELRRASAEIESLAFYDALTGLPNRRLLLDRLGRAIEQARRMGHMGALLFLDLDHFKMLNDSRGHEVGDLLLQQVAQRLSATVRASDTVARLGGDEFVVMLGDLPAGAADAAQLARGVSEKLIARLAEPYVLAGHSYRCTSSVGATLFGQEEQDAAELLKRADIAMYQIKARHGNAVCFFDPQMQVEINQRARLEAELQGAIAAGQFTLYYQPQFTLAGQLVGAEALLRWSHPERGLLLPRDFIAVAEHSGLIVPIGDLVLRLACAQLAAWQGMAACAALQLSVNVSARQFRQGDFADQVVARVQGALARADRLKLELTESLMLEDVQDTIAKMHQLRVKGVRFAMDDFGTGYSSLSYLTQLPLDQLKIDQSFVHHLGERHADDVIVQTIIGMGRTLEIEVLAEGVETQAQRDFLAAHGCALYQGFLFGRPMPALEFEALAARHGGSAA